MTQRTNGDYISKRLSKHGMSVEQNFSQCSQHGLGGIFIWPRLKELKVYLLLGLWTGAIS